MAGQGTDVQSNSIVDAGDSASTPRVPWESAYMPTAYLALRVRYVPGGESHAVPWIGKWAPQGGVAGRPDKTRD